MTVTLRLRSMVWFATGAGLAVVVMLAVLSALRADAAAPGVEDSTFVPVTPCRLLDTRPSNGLTPSEIRTLDAHGVNGGCSLPTEAVGLSMNVTALNATAETFLTIWPDGVPQPNSSSLNPAPGQPPIPNAVTTPISSAGKFQVFNYDGDVNVIIDVNGYYTKSTLAALDDRVKDLEAKLASVSALSVDGFPTVRFTDVNVQVVNGTGNSRCSVAGLAACNGLGNLIVGYNEDSLDAEKRSGSHNIVVGTDNDWTSHSGIVAGRWNTISGEYSSVSGGAHGLASGTDSSVSGGSHGWASGPASSVSGGAVNRAAGLYSSVSGGELNTAAGRNSSVSGGAVNTAEGSYSSVSGGEHNTATGWYSSVSGGTMNTAEGRSSSVTGGGGVDTGNTASGNYSSVTGGLSNNATTTWATVTGGENNTASGSGSTVTGGANNDGSGTRATVSGGEGCTLASSDGAAVGDNDGTTCLNLN